MSFGFGFVRTFFRDVAFRGSYVVGFVVREAGLVSYFCGFGFRRIVFLSSGWVVRIVA